MRLPPPLIALASAAAQRALSSGSTPPGVIRKAASAAMGGASVALMGTAVQTFRSSGTTVDPLRPERASTLVTGGPFALTRNPMYVGMAGLLVAHAWLRGSVRALIPVAGFVAVMDRVQIPPEETAMTALFEDDYAEYRSRVPRWIGPPGSLSARQEGPRS